MTGALLIAFNYTAQSHSGVIHLLGLYFIKPGKVSKEAGKIYSRLYEIRQTGDYDDLFQLEESDILPLIKPAEKYIEELKSFLNKK